MSEIAYTPDEIMTITAARRLAGTAVCFVGIGLPSAAANLARLTHAPNLVLVYESGAIGAKPSVLPLSIGDGELAETADAVVSVPEIFNYWLQGGRIDLGFLGAAQIDRFGNINTTVIGGSYDAPKVRLPGAGGASEIASGAREVLIIVRHARRAFVPALDFVTSSGFLLDGQGHPLPTPHGRGPTTVISDLAVLHSDPVTKELVLHSLHPGVSMEQVRQATGWELRSVAHPSTTPPPSANELAALRDLYARTAAAHQPGSAPDPAALGGRLKTPRAERASPAATPARGSRAVPASRSRATERPTPGPPARSAGVATEATPSKSGPATNSR